MRSPHEYFDALAADELVGERGQAQPLALTEFKVHHPRITDGLQQAQMEAYILEERLRFIARQWAANWREAVAAGDRPRARGIRLFLLEGLRLHGFWTSPRARLAKQRARDRQRKRKTELQRQRRARR